MIDSADTSTVDLFPQPKIRGRQSTGNAKSGAARAAACRLKKQRSGAVGMYNLNLWVDASAKFDLDRLARQAGITRGAMLERLIKAADLAAVAGFDIDSQEWDDYFK